MRTTETLAEVVPVADVTGECDFVRDAEWLVDREIVLLIEADDEKLVDAERVIESETDVLAMEVRDALGDGERVFDDTDVSDCDTVSEWLQTLVAVLLNDGEIVSVAASGETQLGRSAAPPKNHDASSTELRLQ